ncbi:hypothetical protein HMPREF1326_00856 [Akkermansia sp. KLE1605]|nr:hypothetical protein HMPREF1326_00856 [Akkermansia sp. KLE1605]
MTQELLPCGEGRFSGSFRGRGSLPHPGGPPVRSGGRKAAQ